MRDFGEDTWATVASVEIRRTQTELVGAHSSGVRVLQVTTLAEWPETGTLSVGGDELAYVNITDLNPDSGPTDNPTITLAADTVTGYSDGATVLAVPSREHKIALVFIDGVEQPVEALVPGHWHDKLHEGQESRGQVVLLEPRGQSFVVKDATGRPQIDGGYLHPDKPIPASSLQQTFTTATMAELNGIIMPRMLAVSGGGVMTTLGDLLYEDATPTPARLAGNTTTTKKFLAQTGNGTISAVPAWTQPVLGDLGTTAADFSMNSHKITDVSDPVSAQDAATKNWVQTRLFVSELTSTATLSNNNADTVMWTATNVAAAALVAGTTCFHFRLGGTLDNIATSGLLDMKLKINTTLVVTIGLISNSQTGAASGTPYSVAGSIFVDTIGGSGVVTIIGDSVCLTTAGGGQNPRPFMATSSAISLTGGLQLTVTGDWVTAALSNTLRLNRAVMNQVA